MSNYIDEVLARAEKATEGPWLYRSDNSSKQAIECEECGNEFPEQGYSLRSIDEYTVLHGELYGMESLCQPNGEFIAHARTDVPELAKRLQIAIRYIRASRDFDPKLADELEAPLEEK